MTDETSMIRSFIEHWGDLAVGIGDDGAMLDVPAGEKLVVSTDASVENVHFKRADLSPGEIGYRTAAAALSDLAAMASRPLGLLFALILPAGWRDDALALAEGVGEAARSAGCPVIGGNISSGGELSITATVLGSSKNPLARSGARAGDRVYVTGSLGGAAAAVGAWRRGDRPTPPHRARFAAPTPRIAEALWLAEHGATSAIDISDGLATDARHLASASAVKFVIDVARIPVADGVTLDDALTGGEDYELIVTATSLDGGAFAKKFNLPLTDIGFVSEGEAGLELRRDDGEMTAPRGFDHLAAK